MREPWWRRAVVYQVYPRSFADSDGDGIGDLGGVIAHLDHIARLGADAIWLSPVYRSPQADNGYDVSDYEDIDPVFGTLAQLDELIALAHERGIRIVMDLVVNHTSDEHPWFAESRAGRDSPKRDWYLWRDGREGAEPNNWGSLFSGSAWTLDETTGQYYLHLFDAKQPDLDWGNREVRQAVYAMMRRWLDRGVDGFRMDVVNFLAKARGLPDARPVSGQQHPVAFEHFADGPGMHELLHEMHEQVFAGREPAVLTVGEMPGVSVEEALRYTDPDRAEVDMVFQFEHVGLDQGDTKFDLVPLDRLALKRSLHRWQVALGERGWNSLYWNNHDQPRAVSRFGDDEPGYREPSAKTLATILHGMRGTPFVYQGEELGMTNYPFTAPGQLRDVEAVSRWRAVLAEGLDQQRALDGLRTMTRDNARTPMQWEAGPRAGFTTGDPWLPPNPNTDWLNAAAQVGRPGSVFEHYRELIRLRHTQPVLVDGRFAPLLDDDAEIWAYARDSADARLLVVANCGRVPRIAAVGAEWDGARLLLGSTTETPADVVGGRVALGGWDAGMYLLERPVLSARAD